MLIRLISRYKNLNRGLVDCDLVDILRTLSTQDSESVITRTWLVQDLVYHAYDHYNKDINGLPSLFPELELTRGQTHALVNGERLLERSSVVHQFEEGYFLRVANTQSEVIVNAEYRLFGGPSHFQASNVDLEIRRAEVGPYEVVTEDADIIAHLQYSFAITEIEP